MHVCTRVCLFTAVCIRPCASTHYSWRTRYCARACVPTCVYQPDFSYSGWSQNASENHLLLYITPTWGSYQLLEAPNTFVEQRGSKHSLLYHFAVTLVQLLKKVAEELGIALTLDMLQLITAYKPSHYCK